MAVVKKRRTATKTRSANKTSSDDIRALEMAAKENFEEQNNLTYTEDCMSIYAKQTIENRAIPDYRDGLIPVQRRILYAMYRLHIAHLVKSARVIGEVLGKWHPHGDTACYGAMVTLVNAPLKLIEGAGNWGSYENPKSFAAMRYTECKLSKLAQKIFVSGYLTKAYDLVPNFDDTEVEPAVLHTNFPVALALGKLGGIAVGVTCNTPSFTLESVGNLTRQALQGKKITPKMCMDNLVFNFSWGGTIDEKHIKDGSLLEMYKNGSATLGFRPEYEVNAEDGTLIIKSVPPNANYISCMEKTHEKGYSVSDITTVGSVGYEIIVDLSHSKYSKRTTKGFTIDPEVIADVVRIWTGKSIPIRVAITDRQMTDEAAVEGTSKLDIEFAPTVGIHDYIMKWAQYRLDLEVQLAKLEREDLKADIAKLDLIILARENFDIVKKALDQESPVEYFVSALKKSKKITITLEDSSYIFSRTLIQLSKTDIEAVKEKITNLKERIKTCNARIKNPSPYAVKELDAVLAV